MIEKLFRKTKKVVAWSLVIVMLLSLAACGSKEDNKGEDETKETTQDGGVAEMTGNTQRDDAKDTYIAGLESFELGDVDVTEDYFANAFNNDVKYLLSLDSDKMLAGFRETAGLDMKSATRYGGWENSLIGGHTMGHYLTACAQAYASLDEGADKKAVKEKLDYIVGALKECQTATGTGYIFGSTILDKANIEKQFDNVESGLTNITTQAWVPWYTMHKILAGLVEVYELTGSETSLEVAKSLGTWVYNRTDKWTDAVRNRVLGIEYGGMNDCLYELYAVTGDEKFAVAAHKFDEDALYASVAAGAENALNEKHANTTIPKFLGALNRYITAEGKTINGEKVDSSKYLSYAEAFWDMVVNKHSYITGGNSEWEHFGKDNILDAERTNCNCETCNAYNMLKLSRKLYMITGKAKYLDYYENTLLNSIMSSQNPETGMTTYFQPMATGYFKVYGSETGHFWCCTGSGMENFTKLGDSIYYKKDNMLVVSQYISSVLTWSDKNLTLTQNSDIPDSDKAEFEVKAIKDGSIDAEIAFRIPDWAAEDVVIKVNGEKADTDCKSGYLILKNLKDGDKITVTIPMQIKAYNLADNENCYAFKYGPIVLSAELGSKDMTTTTTGVNVTVPATKLIETTYTSAGTEKVSVTNGSLEDFFKNINSNLVKTEGKLEWKLKNTNANLIFTPHYSKYTQRYGIYWQFNSDSSAVNATELINERNESRFQKALIDTVQPGYGQYENDELHDMQELKTGSTGDTSDGTSRYANAGGAFSYRMKVAKDEDNYLQLTFKKDDNGKSIKVTIDGTSIYEEKLNYTGSDSTYDVLIKMPKDVVNDKAETVTLSDGSKVSAVKVIFESVNNEASARIYGFAYTLHAYDTQVSLEVSADNGDISTDGKKSTITIEKDCKEVNVNVDIANKNGYITINGIVADDTKAYKVDMESSNFASLEYVVYAEDHTTKETYTIDIKKDGATELRENVDNNLAYFVDCGDHVTSTLSEGDKFGTNNSVTDQAYGMDAVTGFKWGIIDDATDKQGGSSLSSAVYTANTWAYEFATEDNQNKTVTNRYTKNQFENGITPRYIDYGFELKNGTYEVEVGFTDPWGCSNNPAVYANHDKDNQVVIADKVNISSNPVATGTVKVTNGELTINMRSVENSTLAINVTYIKIKIVELDDKSDNSDKSDASDKNDNGSDTKADSETNSIIPIIIGVVVAIVIVAAIVLVVLKKKKRK